MRKFFGKFDPVRRSTAVRAGLSLIGKDDAVDDQLPELTVYKSSR